MDFAGFTEADFDAYLAPRAGSNAFNRPRLEVKQKALALTRRFHDAAISRGTPLETRASEEFPSLWNKRQVTAQWVFFWRDQDARKRLEEILDKGRTLAATLTDPTPYFRHAFLAFYIDVAAVEVALRIHGDAWVDVRNLRARCASETARAELLTALKALPADFRVGVTGGAMTLVSELDDAALGRTLDALTESSQWWFVGRTIDRADAVRRGKDIAEALAEGFEALLPVYRLVAWSHDNDLVSIEREIEAVHRERQAHIDETAAREAAWKAQHEAEIQKRREAAAVEARERVASLAPARPAAVHAAVQHVVQSAPPPPESEMGPRHADGASERPSRPHTRPPERREERPERKEPRRETRPAPARVEARKNESIAPKVASETPSVKPPPKSVAPKQLVETAGPVVNGSKVKIQAGHFAGKVGTVTGLDSKGQVKVSFGLITAWIAPSDLVALTER